MGMLLPTHTNRINAHKHSPTAVAANSDNSLDCLNSKYHVPSKTPTLPTIEMTIDARSTTSTASLEAHNPATGEFLSSIPLADESHLEHAIDAAQRAFPTWSQSEPQRRRALNECAKIIRKHLEDLSILITLEQGKPIAEARSEVSYAASQFALYSEMPIPGSQSSNARIPQTQVKQRPYGIVGLLTPWNFPIGTACVKLAPALLIGNVVILKPSHHASLATLRLGQLLKECLPAGTLNILSGDDDLGAQITQHPSIPKISLTGSVSTGTATLTAAASHIKSVTLELGGNDPAIILSDANPKSIAQPILDAAWRNAGQVCSAIKRIYVHDSLLKNVLEALQERASSIHLGDGMLPKTNMGPLTTTRQFDRAHHYAQSVTDWDGNILPATRTKNCKGNFFTPTLATNIDHNHPLVQEEQFCPILPIIPYHDIEEAITWANDSEFGLSASVWTETPQLGYEIANQLQCGRVGINGHRRGEFPAPFGGWKKSGIGRELGEWGLLEMSQSQVINLF